MASLFSNVNMDQNFLQQQDNRYLTPYDQQFDGNKPVDFEIEQAIFGGSDGMPNDFDQAFAQHKFGEVSQDEFERDGELSSIEQNNAGLFRSPVPAPQGIVNPHSIP